MQVNEVEVSNVVEIYQQTTKVSANASYTRAITLRVTFCHPASKFPLIVHGAFVSPKRKQRHKNNNTTVKIIFCTAPALPGKGLVHHPSMQTTGSHMANFNATGQVAHTIVCINQCFAFPASAHWTNKTSHIPDTKADMNNIWPV